MNILHPAVDAGTPSRQFNEEGCEIAPVRFAGFEGGTHQEEPLSYRSSSRVLGISGVWQSSLVVIQNLLKAWFVFACATCVRKAWKSNSASSIRWQRCEQLQWTIDQGVVCSFPYPAQDVATFGDLQLLKTFRHYIEFSCSRSSGHQGLNEAHWFNPSTPCPCTIHH
ncbi:LOW QUALITY PROTEIN: hypothetical protein ACHAXR_000947 [Thalassiosira sp. AJA248-18]